MNHDTFLENCWEVIKILLKTLIALVIVQASLMILGYDLKIPFIYSALLDVFGWFQIVGGNYRFGF